MHDLLLFLNKGCIFELGGRLRKCETYSHSGSSKAFSFSFSAVRGFLSSLPLDASGKIRFKDSFSSTFTFLLFSCKCLSLFFDFWCSSHVCIEKVGLPERLDSTWQMKYHFFSPSIIFTCTASSFSLRATNAWVSSIQAT